MSDDFQSHELVTATKLNRALRAGRCLGRARRVIDSSTTTSTTRVAVLRLDDIPIVGGRGYTIKSNALGIDGVTNNDVAAVDLTYTTDGSTPTISSSVLPGSQAEIIQPSAANFVTTAIDTTYIPAADETLSLLLCIRHTAGTGAMRITADGAAKIIEIKVMDNGEDPGDTGVDL